MTPQMVKDRIAHIKGLTGDDDEAHAAEDALFFDVLKAIAHGSDRPALLAALALQSKDLSFARFCV